MPDAPPEFDYEATLAACASGSHEALHKLYEQEGARLLGVVQRIVRDIALAEDIVHDAYINIWTRATSFDSTRGSARGWIYSVARHLALNAVRHGSREVDLDEGSLAAINAQASMAAWQDQAGSLARQASPGRIEHCLEQLEPARRNCILHAYVDGLSHGEISHRLGTPLGTVKSWIKRSLRTLQECLS